MPLGVLSCGRTNRAFCGGLIAVTVSLSGQVHQTGCVYDRPFARLVRVLQRFPEGREREIGPHHSLVPTEAIQASGLT